MKKTIILMAVGAGLLTACQVKNKPEEITDAVSVETISVEPDDYLNKALDFFAEGKYDSSAKYINRAAESMDAIAAVAGGERGEKIRESVEEMQDLASDVATDHVDGIEELNYFFGKAGRALAGYTMTVSEEEFANLNDDQAASLFGKAWSKVEQSTRYHARALNAEEKQLMDDAKKLDEKIKAGEKTDRQEISAMLNRLKKQVKTWDEEFNRKK